MKLRQASALKNEGAGIGCLVWIVFLLILRPKTGEVTILSKNSGFLAT
jgi:hypothetical protein